jgi:hypothetical protein
MQRELEALRNTASEYSENSRAPGDLEAIWPPLAVNFDEWRKLMLTHIVLLRRDSTASPRTVPRWPRARSSCVGGMLRTRSRQQAAQLPA